MSGVPGQAHDLTCGRSDLMTSFWTSDGLSGDVPESDALEQRTPVEPEEGEPAGAYNASTLEADEADLSEQAAIVPNGDEDDYRG
jgi:hypothetical protein